MTIPEDHQVNLYWSPTKGKYTNAPGEHDCYVGDLLGWDDVTIMECDEALARELWNYRTLFPKKDA